MLLNGVIFIAHQPLVHLGVCARTACTIPTEKPLSLHTTDCLAVAPKPVFSFFQTLHVVHVW